MVKNRLFSYETLVCHEGRWLIHSIVPEEEDAVAIGRDSCPSRVTRRSGWCVTAP